MLQSDTGRLRDVLAALQLLSRLPLPGGFRPMRAASAWAWPLAGAVLGLIVALVGMLSLGLGANIAAALALGTQVMLTGAMHEDGLADSADGLWGGWEKARRLAIMKDSHIGTYGVMALLVIGLIRWSALAALLQAGQWPVIIIVAGLSRAPMALLIAYLPNARGEGLAQSVGQLPKHAAHIAFAIGCALALSLGWGGFYMIFAVCLTSFTLARLARAKIGGQTGDILGASQQLAEAAALGCAVALL